MMTPKLMIEPSYWLGTGIKLEKVNNLNLFKFTDELQARSDELLERSKSGLITPEEKAELDGISELAQIFTYANSVLAAESKWFPNPSEKSSLNRAKYLYEYCHSAEFVNTDGFAVDYLKFALLNN